MAKQALKSSFCMDLSVEERRVIAKPGWKNQAHSPVNQPELQMKVWILDSGGAASCSHPNCACFLIFNK